MCFTEEQGAKRGSGVKAGEEEVVGRGKDLWGLWVRADSGVIRSHGRALGSGMPRPSVLIYFPRFAKVVVEIHIT